MYVQVIQMQLKPAALFQAKRIWQDSVLPELQLQKGWTDGAFSTSGDGKALAFTVWETQDLALGFGTTRALQKELGKLTRLSTGEIDRVVYRLGTAEAETYDHCRQPSVSYN